MKKHAGITNAELAAKLANDPEYQARIRERDLKLSLIAEGRRREQKSLLYDLAMAGAVVDWVGQLLEVPAPDERIYPVLLDHITKPYSPWLLEWIGRAFGRRSARPIVWERLIDLVNAHALQESATEGVLVAISAMAQPSDLHTLIDLLSDRSLGQGRIYLVSNLMRSKRQEARAALIKNQTDPELTIEITDRLSRSRG
jgi:hypothetical protein